MQPSSRAAQVPITPSASPAPSSNPRFFFPAPYRIADEAPPAKRQRASSTSRRASSSATPDDFNIEREASAMRMFDVWSQLADKYSRRIDEDDIVDLATGEIVKDRGVLSAETPWKFGRFADLDDSVATDEDEEDEEDDVDELDAFAGSRATEEVSVRGVGWTVPPVREMDPADAKDLAEFMEAENRRREECGDEEESEDGGGVFENPEVGQETGDESDASDLVQIPVSAPPLSSQAEVDDSDDELGNWDVVDASNIVVRVTDKVVDQPEIIELLDSPSSKTPSPFKSTPKSRTDRKPQPRLQLITPPHSRTPSSVLSSADDHLVPIPSPPSSPLPPPDSSPIKAKSKLASHRVSRPSSQVRTRSQSRARSPHSSRDEDTLPRLDLTDVKRGRSVHKTTHRGGSTRASLANAEETVGKRKPSTNSTLINRDLPTREKQNPQLPSSSSTQTKRGNTRSSPEPRASATSSESLDILEKLSGSNRKGKGRLLDVEHPFVDSDRWWEGGGDLDGLTSSPPQATKPTGLRYSLKSGPQSMPSSSPAVSILEHKPTSSRKRKRTSFSEGLDVSLTSIDAQPSSSSFESPSSSPHKIRTHPSSVSARSPKRTICDPEVFYPDPDPEYETERASSHRPPMPASTASFYPQPPPPGTFYPYPPYNPGPDLHPLMPLQDPRAQFIITQAVHQLHALYTTSWPAQPFTPPRRTSTARSASASGSSPYSYPRTPHHPHTYPYGFDSGASSATLPPSSPPSSSPTSLPSSPIHGHGGGRRASLVSRSRSRGRRVSFRIDGELRDDEDEAHSGSPNSPPNRSRLRQHDDEESEGGSDSYSMKRKDKGKKKVAEADFSESRASRNGSDSQVKTRARLAERAQTPGPPIARTAHGGTSSTIVPADSVGSKPKGKAQKL
ncbi:hypothetical protein B0H11DRAFT_1977954 [Mycena galericulata]|nr:hypothetical protein B0H11DRAFT_1977954 [Mycena galericulata]